MDNSIDRVNRKTDTFSVEFGQRLQEERERRGLNQADFGALGGVAKVAQLNYEKGYRVPNAWYLSKLRQHGVDVEYLLSGQPSVPINERLDPTLLSSAMAAVLQELARHGYKLESDHEGLALVLAVYDAHRDMAGFGLAIEKTASSIVKGWFIGRSGGG